MNSNNIFKFFWSHIYSCGSQSGSLPESSGKYVKMQTYRIRMPSAGVEPGQMVSQNSEVMASCSWWTVDCPPNAFPTSPFLMVPRFQLDSHLSPCSPHLFFQNKLSPPLAPPWFGWNLSMGWSCDLCNQGWSQDFLIRMARHKPSIFHQNWRGTS